MSTVAYCFYPPHLTPCRCAARSNDSSEFTLIRSRNSGGGGGVLGGGGGLAFFPGVGK
jgi:hypothetical protein